MTDVKENIRLLFDRPSEPIFMPKGKDATVFEVPKNYLGENYENREVELQSRFGSASVPIKSIAPPDLSVALELPRKADFSLFIPKHQKIAASLIDIFMKVPNNELNDFLATVAYARDKVNSQLWNYALSVALMHREDTRDIDLPNYMETFPSKFIDSRFMQESREISFVINTPQDRQPIIIPRDFSASDLEEEHRIAYFREDVGINLHHWHWHLVYPFTSATPGIVRKDRRGELFYYMHQQLVARYNAERLCNTLPRVRRFNNFRQPIAEGYFPKLDSLTSGRTWPGRQANTGWSDLNRAIDTIRMTISDAETWRTRIEAAINSGNVTMPDGSTRPLDIDTLGNMIEASDLSPNAAFYGTLHNSGHLFSAYIHDPEHRYLERFSVMADSGTTMRDPFFYRWHAFIDDLFQKFKSSALSPPYTRSQLINPNVSVDSIQINGQAGVNNLQTFWMESDVDMSRGLDFSDRGAVLVRLTHLNHTPFSYSITVNNSGAAKKGTVRIFMAPKNDERGLPLSLNEQRLLFIEMDRFVQDLPRGRSTINRRSDQSSVTIPFERTFRDISGNFTGTNEAIRNFNFCGCGWPHHMLVPKGDVQGKPFQLFVMVSNYTNDSVQQNLEGIQCADASSFCGIKDSLYPDRRAMGYPFDRPPNPQFATVNDFVQTNMKVQDVTIRFNNRTVPNPRNPRRG